VDIFERAIQMSDFDQMAEPVALHYPIRLAAIARRSRPFTTRYPKFAEGERSLAMSPAIQLNDRCPRCGGKLTMQAMIEAHPTNPDIELHNFHCAVCGPVKTKVISLTPKKPHAEIAA
jgi:hypothetical protein